MTQIRPLYTLAVSTHIYPLSIVIFLHLLFQLSIALWGSALSPLLCSDICRVGAATLQQIPRAGFGLTGVYVDPATVAAVTGLIYWMQSSQEPNLLSST